MKMENRSRPAHFAVNRSLSHLFYTRGGAFATNDRQIFKLQDVISRERRSLKTQPTSRWSCPTAESSNNTARTRTKIRAFGRDGEQRDRCINASVLSLCQTEGGTLSWTRPRLSIRGVKIWRGNTWTPAEVISEIKTRGF
jgi:hypothetical protein